MRSSRIGLRFFFAPPVCVTFSFSQIMANVIFNMRHLPTLVFYDLEFDEAEAHVLGHRTTRKSA